MCAQIGQDIFFSYIILQKLKRTNVLNYIVGTIFRFVKQKRVCLQIVHIYLLLKAFNIIENIA